MPEHKSADQHMQDVDWEGGEDLDEEFRQGDCVEVDLGDADEDVPIESDGDEEIEDANSEGEIGVLKDTDIYSDDDGEPYVDECLGSVSHTQSVLSVAFSPTDPSIMVTGGQDDVAVMWTLSERAGRVTCTQRQRMEGHTDSVVQVAFSHDGKYVATAGYDCTCKIWAADTGSLVHSLEGPSKEIEWILWHPKGHAILAGSNDTMAWMWWAPTGKLMQIFAGHAQSVSAGCWCLGGKLICTGSDDKSVIVWNPRAGTPQQNIKQVHESAIVSMCSHPDAPIVVAGSNDSVVKVLQIETGKVLAVLPGHTDSVECIAFNTPAPGSISLLATASMDGKVLVWEGRSFDLRCTLKEHIDKGGIVKFKWLNAPAFSSWLCTCSTDHTLRLFNALTGECAQTFRGHTDTVLDFDISLRATTGTQNVPSLQVASGSDDCTCRVFQAVLEAPKIGELARAVPAQAPADIEAGQTSAAASTEHTTSISPQTDGSPGSLPV